jgi:hypothetical protein
MNYTDQEDTEQPAAAAGLEFSSESLSASSNFSQLKTSTSLNRFSTFRLGDKILDYETKDSTDIDQLDIVKSKHYEKKKEKPN